MSTESSNWYLRKNNNAQYGPVSLDELIQWTSQCRVVAGNRVSQDRQTWTPVEDLSELQMDWIAKRKDGKQYGPFPLAAVPELVEHDVLPLDAILTHRSSAESRDIQAVLKSLDTSPRTTAPPHTAHTTRNRKNARTADDDDDKQPARENQATDHDAPKDEPPTEDAPPAAAPKENMPPTARPDTESLEKKLLETQALLETEQAACRAIHKDNQTMLARLEKIAAEQQDLQAEQQAERKAFEKQRATWQASIQEMEASLDETRDQLQAALKRHDGQQDSALTELRQQSAFMKKNIAALHAELSAAKQGILHRDRMLAAALVTITLLMILLIATISRGGCRARSPEADPVSSGVSDPLPQPFLEDPLPASSQPDTRRPTDARPAATAEATLPRVQLEGVTVQHDGPRAILLRFDVSLFRSLATLSNEGRSTLDSLARQLPARLDGLRIVIEGHTDNIPLRSTAQFANNEALALARAQTVADHFSQRAGFPAAAIQARAGTTAPFPNDTAENRERNRTVTIRIMRP